MLSPAEQDAIVRKAQSMARNLHFRRLKVAKGEMSRMRCDELCEQDEEELRQLMKGQP